MVEKGLLSHYTQKQDLNNEHIAKITSDENIEGLQWSVAVAPGIDYKLNKNYSIYLEPKVSYYFDNNQPISARTEHPVVFGVNAGFRFSW
jgi:predicted porin